MMEVGEVIEMVEVMEVAGSWASHCLSWRSRFLTVKNYLSQVRESHVLCPPVRVYHVLCPLVRVHHVLCFLVS